MPRDSETGKIRSNLSVPHPLNCGKVFRENVAVKEFFSTNN